MNHGLASLRDDLTFIQDVLKAGLPAVPDSLERPMTLLAPVDSAFRASSIGRSHAFLNDRSMARSLIDRHLLATPVSAADLMSRPSWTTVSGHGLTVQAGRLNLARLLDVDFACNRWSVHVIDRLLLSGKDLESLTAESVAPRTVSAKRVETPNEDWKMSTGPVYFRPVSGPSDRLFIATEHRTVQKSEIQFIEYPQDDGNEGYSPWQSSNHSCAACVQWQEYPS